MNRIECNNWAVILLILSIAAAPFIVPTLFITQTHEPQEAIAICGTGFYEQEKLNLSYKPELEKEFGTRFNHENGERLFDANCTACHVIGDKKIVGPGLSNLRDKYDSDYEWIEAYIIDAENLRSIGDPRSLSLYEEYGRIENGHDFKILTYQERKDLLGFLILKTL